MVIEETGEVTMTSEKKEEISEAEIDRLAKMAVKDSGEATAPKFMSKEGPLRGKCFLAFHKIPLCTLKVTAHCAQPVSDVCYRYAGSLAAYSGATVQR